MKRLNRLVTIGLAVNGLTLLANKLNVLPEIIHCFCAGLGISLILIGLLAGNHKISKLRGYKKMLYKALGK